MGASNAVRVYATWGHLADRPLRVLTYMALVARDNDAAPWFGQGHEALAVFALSLTPDDAGLRAVRRAVTALHDAGAIETVRRATFGKRGTSHVQYRLWLDGPCPQDGQRPMAPVDNHPAKHVDNPAPQDAQRPMAAESIGRSVVVHRTVSGRPQVAERPTKEEEEEEERINPEANLRNGEMWKGDAPAREPSGRSVPAMSQIERAAWQAAESRRLRAGADSA